eukprot:TRINITY_DN8466_c0_g1_i1.p1 TRINITY_DN8466_c0_g1~~TRINITY_DN8466_c0_g1_i1.p1  ORF type:complete len:642 (+),score=208.30 TRINITY_DN8466_c0_g1_i1:34-1959(+)
MSTAEREGGTAVGDEGQEEEVPEQVEVIKEEAVHIEDEKEEVHETEERKEEGVQEEEEVAHEEHDVPEDQVREEAQAEQEMVPKQEHEQAPEEHIQEQEPEPVPEVHEQEPEMHKQEPEPVPQMLEQERENVPEISEQAPEQAPEQEEEERVERGPSVSSSGGVSGGVSDERALELLKQECEDVEALHLEQLAQIDKVMLDLRESETELMQLVVQDAEYVEATEAKLKEVEVLDAIKQVETQELQDELNRLEAEAAATASEERQLTSRHNSLMSQVDRLERRIADEELLSGNQQTYKETVALLTEREGRLRNLEDTILAVDDIIEDQTRALEKLRHEYAGLAEVRNMTCSSAEEELHESKKVADTLQRTLSRLLLRRDEARARHGGVRSTVASLDETISRMQETKRELEDELKEKTAVRDAAERSLDAYIEQVIGGTGTNTRLEKINEVMMLLKGKAVNLGLDHPFVGEVQEAYCGCPMEGFETGFNYVKAYIVAAHGEQRHNARWILDETKEPTYDEVESILTAVKQLVVCYDMMDNSTRRNLLITREVIRNGGNLVYLAEICSTKYAELMEERRVKQIEEEAERKLRIRRSIAPKLAKSVIGPNYKVSTVTPAITPSTPAGAISTRKKSGPPQPPSREF